MRKKQSNSGARAMPGADFLSPKVKWAHLDLWYSQDEERTGTV